VDGDFAVLEVIDRDDLQHAAPAVGADVENAINVIDVGFNWASCDCIVNGVMDIRVGDPVAAGAVPDLHP